MQRSAAMTAMTTRTVIALMGTVMAAVTATRAAVILTEVTGMQHRADPGQRLCPRHGEQCVRCLSAVFAGTGHAGGYQARNQGCRERRAAPASHPVKLPLPAGIWRLVAGVHAGRESIDQVLAGRVDIDPAAMVAERSTAAPACRERAHGHHLREGRGPERPTVAVVACRGDEQHAFMVAIPPPQCLKAQRRNVLPARR